MIYKDLNNKYRVLLTETLPYELPLTLNNDVFFENMKNDDLRNIFKEAFNGIVKKHSFTIPFDYNVRRFNGEKSRRLSLIHPLTQLDIVKFYNEFDEYLIKLSSRSPFSIRFIAGKARSVFPLESNDDDEKDKDDINVEERVVELKEMEIERMYRSYFTYKRYDLMYKFFNSGDYLRLEQKYRKMMTMDIARCFYHIYTHTIAWAVKGKETAKLNIAKETFENKFDHLMQHTNYNETNGIVVGPELSRIFAEVILQSIDVAVLNSLRDGKYNLRLGKDYEVRRYVDDYYVFSNSEETLDIIKDTFKKELERYKLYLNTSKLEYFERPFVSEINIAKKTINNIVTKFKNNYLLKEDKKYARQHININAFTNFVNEFRNIAKKYNQKYGQLNRYLLSLLSKQIRKEKESRTKPFEDLLSTYVDISFYIFSLDMSTTASYRLCRIIQLLMEWTKLADDPLILRTNVEARINREVKRIFDIYASQRLDGDTNMEIMNILLTLDSSTNIKLPKKILCLLFHIEDLSDNELDELNYFQICTILRIIKNEIKYTDIYDALRAHLPNYFSTPACLKHADKAQLFFDLVVCPYLDKNIKLDIIEKVMSIGREKCGIWLSKLNTTRQWFFDWDSSHEISRFLIKKEYHSPYE